MSITHTTSRRGLVWAPPDDEAGALLLDMSLRLDMLSVWRTPQPLGMLDSGRMRLIEKEGLLITLMLKRTCIRYFKERKDTDPLSAKAQVKLNGALGGVRALLRKVNKLELLYFGSILQTFLKTNLLSFKIKTNLQK